MSDVLALGGDFYTALFGFLTVFLLVVVAVCFLEPRKTKKYRRELADMYVASKIRSIATKEGFNLSEEYNLFRNWSKKKKRESYNYNYDDVVEEEMQEKVEDQLKDKQTKETKKK